jgi:hypothetical protein
MGNRTQKQSEIKSKVAEVEAEGEGLIDVCSSSSSSSSIVAVVGGDRRTKLMRVIYSRARQVEMFLQRW